MRKSALVLAVASITASVANAGTVTTDGADIVIKTKGGFEAKTADGKYSFKTGGRIQWDYDDTDGKDSDMDIRRARIFFSGTANDWAYKSQFNVDNGDGDGGTVEDLYIRYTGWGKMVNLTVGKQKEPFGLEEQISSKDITALERSAMTEAYVPGRGVGIQLHGKGSNWTYGIGAFESEDTAEDIAITGRVTFAPIKSGKTVVHLGAGVTNRGAAESDDEFEAFNVEAAMAAGPVHAQIEYFDGEDGDQTIDGFYVQGGWIITGESRPYKDGKFKKVKGKSDIGAWEVYLRYEDGHGKFSDIGLSTDDGEQATYGVNWYANNNVRVGVSYMDGETDDTDGDELRARLQFTW